MKNMKLLALLVALSATGVNAQKHQFGFVFKAGNATKPERVEQSSVFNREVDWVKSGNVALAGITSRYKLSKGLFLTGELLYRFTDVSYGYEYFNIYPQDVRQNIQTDRFTESSFLLPIKLEWAPFRKKRTTIGVGLGISKVIAGEVSSASSVTSSLFPQLNRDFRTQKASIYSRDYPFEWTFNAGISQQLSRQTSIGLEITVEPDRMVLHASLSTYAIQDCRCSYYTYLKPPGLLSLTLSVRHFLMPDTE